MILILKQGVSYPIFIFVLVIQFISSRSEKVICCYTSSVIALVVVSKSPCYLWQEPSQLGLKKYPER